MIAVGEGGYLETVTDGNTGILLKSDFSLGDLVSAVRKMTPDFRNSLRENCVNQAKKFSLERFERKLLEFVND